jgi:hypothetical protein
MLQSFLIFVGAGYEVFKVVRIHDVVMLKYMVLNVLGEYSGSIFTGY